MNNIRNILACGRIFLFLSGTLFLVVWQLIYMLPQFVTGRLSKRQSPIVRLWYHYILWVMNIHVDITHKRKKTRQQTIYLANHSSYLDILVLGAYFDCFFVAKSDIAGWPIFGFLSKVGGTIFITRERRFVKDQLTLLKKHLGAGQNLLIFPEGTTTNGREIIRFKSSLMNCAYDVPKAPAIQPLTVAYTRMNGKLIHDQATMDKIAWYADFSLAPHLWAVMKQNSIHVQVIVQDALDIADFENSKQVAAKAQEEVEDSFYKTLHITR